MTEIINHPNQEYPITHVARKLGENEEFDKFVQLLCDQIKKAKKDRKFLEDDWDACEKNYYATNTRDDAGSRDSQLDFTITFEICRDAAANLKNPVFAQDTVYMAQGRPGFKRMAAETDTLLDWMTDRADMQSLVDDSLRVSQIFTKAICKVGWQYSERKVKFWDEAEDGSAAESEKTITEDEGCFPYIVDTRRIYHPIPCKSIKESPWFSEEFDTTRAQIKQEIERGFYREDLDPKAVCNEGRKPEHDKTELAAAYNQETVGSEKTEDNEPIRLHECYTSYENREVIIFLDLERRTWCAAIDNFFQSRPRPYVEFSWHPILHSIDGKSLCSILEPGHRAYTAIMNILLDTGARSVEPLIIALKDLGLSEYLDRGRLGPGLAEVDRPVVEDLDRGIKVVELTNGNPTFLVEMLGKIEKHMRDAASIPAAFRGEELAERPTATGTSAILEKAMQPLYDQMERYRKFLNEVARMQYARYRQFFPQSMELFLSTRGEGGEMMRQVISFDPGYWEDQVFIETKVNAQTMSKSIKKQEALAMVDKIPQLWEVVAGMTAAATSGQPISIMAGNFLDVMSIVLTDFFTEFEVPEVRDVLKIQGSKMAGDAVAQALSQLQGIIEQQAASITALQSQVLDLGGILPEEQLAAGQPQQAGPGPSEAAA